MEGERFTISLEGIHSESRGLFIQGMDRVDSNVVRIFEASCRALGLIPLPQAKGPYQLLAPSGLHSGIVCELQPHIDNLAFSNPDLKVCPFQVRQF